MSDVRAAVPTSASYAPSLTDRDSLRQFADGLVPRADRYLDRGGKPSNTRQERLPNVGDAPAPTTADDIEIGPTRTSTTGSATRI